MTPGLFGGNGTQPVNEQEAAPRVGKFAPPAMRLFIVRKLVDTGSGPLEVIETKVEAHQFHAGDDRNVLFFNLEDMHNGEAMMRTHRVFYNVEDVEEIDMRPSSIITH